LASFVRRPSIAKDEIDAPFCFFEKTGQGWKIVATVCVTKKDPFPIVRQVLQSGPTGLAVTALRFKNHPGTRLGGDPSGAICAGVINHQNLVESFLMEGLDDARKGAFLVVGWDEDDRFRNEMGTGHKRKRRRLNDQPRRLSIGLG
jgi:hypothetical protein